MKLGLIAGSGNLPRQLAAHLATHDQSNHLPLHVLPIIGHAQPADFLAYPSTPVRLGAVGKIFATLHACQVTDVVMIGGIKRPNLWQLWPDFTLLALLPRLGLFSLGDDALLRNIARIFEERGLRIRGIHEFMPELLAPSGVWGAHVPTAAQQTLVQEGMKAAENLGQADKGQAVVISPQGLQDAEDSRGTDALLKRVAGWPSAARQGAVLVKLCKPQQDRRLDLPTIGPVTVARAAAAGLAGIAVSAGSTLVDDRETCVQQANQQGLFLLGLPS